MLIIENCNWRKKKKQTNKLITLPFSEINNSTTTTTSYHLRPVAEFIKEKHQKYTISFNFASPPILGCKVEKTKLSTVYWTPNIRRFLFFFVLKHPKMPSQKNNVVSIQFALHHAFVQFGTTTTVSRIQTRGKHIVLSLFDIPTLVSDIYTGFRHTTIQSPSGQWRATKITL